MTRYSPLFAFALVLGLSLPVTGDTLAITDVLVFDGSKMIEAATVVATDGTIVAVGPQVEVPAGATVVDGAGKTLLPGFIDCHTHTWGDALVRAAVFGVTTELDMFADPEFAAAQRRAQTAGTANHRADLFSAGFLATAPGGHGTQYGLEVPTLTDASQAEGWVAERLAEGSDYIKIVLEDGTVVGRPLPTLDSDILAALVSAARRQQALAVAHVTTFEKGRVALAAGVDGLVHLFRDLPADDEFIATAAERGLFVAPTLTVVESTLGTASGASLVEDARLEPLLTDLEIAGLQRAFPGNPEVSMDNAYETVRRLHAAGVPILAGTDAPNPGTAHGVSMHRELELLVAAGLDPLAALEAATSAPARAFGLDDRGRIAPGLRADLVLVAGDPRQDITLTRAIRDVWKGGQAIERPLQERTDSSLPLPVGMVADFESGELAAAFGAGWTASTDEMMGGKSTVSLAVVDGGSSGSTKALAIRGEIETGFAFPWAGAMLFTGEAPMSPANLSGAGEIAFRVKGAPGTYRLMVFAESLGQIPSGQTFEVGVEWREVVLATDGFRGADFEALTGLLWSGGPATGAFEITIDEIEFRE